MSAAPAASTYGCHNRAPYLTEVRTTHGETFPFRMAPDCQYTATEAGRVDPKCQACSWRQGLPGPV